MYFFVVYDLLKLKIFFSRIVSMDQKTAINDIPKEQEITVYYLYTLQSVEIKSVRRTNILALI